MYTSRSEDFSKEFKDRAKATIAKVIENFKGYDADGFANCSANLCKDQAREIMDYGHRWKDAEQCFQAMVMRFEQRMFQERGPGFMTLEEVRNIEKMHFAHDYLFQLSAADGVVGAIKCDHWYMFEKAWD